MGGKMGGLLQQHGNTLSSQTSNLGDIRRPWHLDSDLCGQRQFIIEKMSTSHNKRRQAQAQLSGQVSGQVSGQMGGRMPGLVQHHRNTLSSRTSNLGGIRRPWYLDSDVSGQRQFIIEKILHAFQRRPMSPEWRRRLPDFVSRLEKGLYMEAASKEEYIDLRTLDRRLLNLVKRVLAHRSLNQNVHHNSSVGTMIQAPSLQQNGNACSMIPTLGTDISTVNGAGTSNLVPNTIGTGNVPPNSNDISGLVHGNSLLPNDGNSK